MTAQRTAPEVTKPDESAPLALVALSDSDRIAIRFAAGVLTHLAADGGFDPAVTVQFTRSSGVLDAIYSRARDSLRKGGPRATTG